MKHNKLYYLELLTHTSKPKKKNQLRSVPVSQLFSGLPKVEVAGLLIKSVLFTLLRRLVKQINNAFLLERFDFDHKFNDTKLCKERAMMRNK